MSWFAPFAVCLAILSITSRSRGYSILGENDVFSFDGGTAWVSLAGYDIDEEVEQAFSGVVTLPANRTVGIEVVDVPVGPVAFVVVQIHAYLDNVTLSYDEVPRRGRFSEGASNGLVVGVVGGNKVTRTYVVNRNQNDVRALVAVVAYRGDAPVPGGCNMEFDTEIAPYQKLKITDATVTVDIQPASTPKNSRDVVACEGNGMRHEMYQWFLSEQDFTADHYFSTIKDALTVEGIRSCGRKIPSSVSGSRMRRVYSAYPGTGSLYAAVAVMGNYTAAYVPALTYACSTLHWTDTCQALNSTFSKLLCAVTLFLGFFTTFLGHKYFKTEMFLLGFLSGGLISYIMIAVLGDYGPSGNIGISVFLGIILGFAWLGFWWLYAIPVLSILLATLTLGFFCASIAYFSSPAGIPYLENDTNFWLMFSLIILCVPLTLSIVPDSANIICCAILGSYAVVISIDHYAGSNLKYIIVNTIRRATSPGFNVAVVSPPFQVKDTFLTFLWAALALSGIFVQLRQNRGKPPFPPGMTIPSGMNGRRNGERTPLLVESRIPVMNAREDDDVFDSPGHKWYNDFKKRFKICVRPQRRI